MLRIIKFLFTGDWHLHQWETIEAKQMIRTTKDGFSTSEVEYKKYTLRCEQCGEIKSVEI